MVDHTLPLAVEEVKCTLQIGHVVGPNGVNGEDVRFILSGYKHTVNLLTGTADKQTDS